MIVARLIEPWTAIAQPMPIRQAAPEDLAEIIRRIMLHYGVRASPEKIKQSSPWMQQAIVDPNRLVLLGPNSFGMARVGTFYGSERQASVDILCCRPIASAAFESLRMLRKMIAWTRRRGAPTLRLEADRGIDFEPFARRLNAERRVSVRYEIPV